MNQREKYDCAVKLLKELNCPDWNLAGLCQRCHLRIQGRVFLPQSYMLEHSDWFKPHLEGYLKSLEGIQLP